MGGVVRRFLLILLATAATLSARRLPIQIFSGANGLPRNIVDCLVPGPTGLLWVCTSEGLARFDGSRFRVFGTADGLPSRQILDFAPARRGGYWVVTDRGLCRLEPDSRVGEPCPILAVDSLSGQYIDRSLLLTSAGETWISTSTALYRVSRDERKLERAAFDLPPNVNIRALAEAPAGGLLISTSVNTVSWSPAAGARDLSSSLGQVSVRQLLTIAPGHVLAPAGDVLLRIKLDPAGGSIRQEITGVRVFNAVLRRRDGSIWTAGFDGIAKLGADADGNLHIDERYTQADGLPPSDIVALAEDLQGDLWGATEGSGVFRISAGGFISYDSSDGLGLNRIAAITEDRQGRLVVQTSWAHEPDVRVKNGGRFTTVAIRHPAWHHYFGWAWNQDILAARNGEWWIAAGQALLHFPKLERTEDLTRVEPRAFDVRSPFPCGEAFRAAEDSAGDVWVSCDGPVRRLARWDASTGNFHFFTSADGWPRDAIATVIREGPPGTFWFGTSVAAVRYRDGRFKAFPLDSSGNSHIIRDLLIDHAGRLWISTHHSGLFRCDNALDAAPVFRHYSVHEGLSADTTSSLIEDVSGYIYIGTARGVDRIDPNAPVEAHRIRRFTPADGLPDSENNVAFRDRYGHLWFGTLNGLAEYDPASDRRRSPPRVYVMRLRVRGVEIPLPWDGTRRLPLNLDADRNQIEIEYAGLDLRSAGSLRYQYRMGRAGSDWNDPVDELSVNFASLSRGASRFEVRAVDSEGQAGTESAAIDLDVMSPLWLRWWSLTGAAAFLIFAGAALYQYRVRHLLSIERLRTRIATDLHDDMGASLTQISILSELAQRNSAPQLLGEIAEIARGMVGDMSDIVWAINPRHDRFEGIMHRMHRFAADTLGGKNIDLEFETSRIPGDSVAPLDIRRPLYLVFKEAVNNIARHARASRTAIRLEEENGFVKLTVEDDGCGFDPARRYSGEGLPSVTRRLREIGGSASWESRPGEGTRFIALLPLRRRNSGLRSAAPFTLLHKLRGSAQAFRRNNGS